MQQTLTPNKFQNPDVTAKGQARARVSFAGYKTVWFNTGTLCNITCVNCYIESSPTNDRLVYLGVADLQTYLNELDVLGGGPLEIGFTGGEPFLNPDMIKMTRLALERGHSVLMLTNAMRPMMRPRVQAGLMDLIHEYGPRLTFRVSLDHWSAALHDTERGQGGFDETCIGVDWLASQGAKIAIAGRTMWGEDAASERNGYHTLIVDRKWPINLDDPLSLILFPEMDASVDVPEITPNDAAFEMGSTLAGAQTDVKLNHPHCAKFCVLGGGSCSA
jgi:Radical SAM superfamily